MNNLYNERRSAQAAAYLLYKAGGSLPFIKLIKLLYFAERYSLEKYGEVITGDNFVSMDHGPVLSRVYDHLKGARRTTKEGWDDWVSDAANYEVSLKNPIQRENFEGTLLALSRSDISSLLHAWNSYGHMDRWDLCDLTHTLEEWEDPQGSSKPIPYERLLKAIGYSPDQVGMMMNHLEEQSFINELHIGA